MPAHAASSAKPTVRRWSSGVVALWRRREVGSRGACFVYEKHVRLFIRLGSQADVAHVLVVRVETSITSCGAASFWPAGLTRMKRAFARNSGRLAAPR